MTILILLKHDIIENKNLKRSFKSYANIKNARSLLQHQQGRLKAKNPFLFTQRKKILLQFFTPSALLLLAMFIDVARLASWLARDIASQNNNTKQLENLISNHKILLYIFLCFFFKYYFLIYSVVTFFECLWELIVCLLSLMPALRHFCFGWCFAGVSWLSGLFPTRFASHTRKKV